MYYTKNCYEECIDKSFLIPARLWLDIEKILSEIRLNASTGRPPLKSKRMLNGIYFLLKTGAHWKAIPRCFGSPSAIHRFFKKLVHANFFKNVWFLEIEKYDAIHGLNLQKQATDCAHHKSPLGCEATGKSPVDRRKFGTKISTISESNGIVLGLAVGASNQNDHQLLLASLCSMPSKLEQPRYKEMNLDAAYDNTESRTILFNYSYVPKISPNQRRKKVRPPNPLGYCRWFIEPVHSWMNKYRSIFIRWCKGAHNYLALAQFAVATIIFNKI